MRFQTGRRHQNSRPPLGGQTAGTLQTHTDTTRHTHTHTHIQSKSQSQVTFTATGDEVLVESPEAGEDGVVALRHPLELAHQHAVLQVPQVNPLSTPRLFSGGVFSVTTNRLPS